MTVSAIGFGCGALMQSPSRKDRMAVLSAALDSGITHFDTARMYGLGRAEAELGTFLRTVDRDSVTIATKFGIDVGGAARRLGRFQAPARALLKRHPRCAASSSGSRNPRRPPGCTTPPARRAAWSAV